jgi:hypothetical protein
MVVTTGSLRVELSGCGLVGATLTCELVFTDQEDGQLGVFVYNAGTGEWTRFVGQDGEEHRAEAARLGSADYGRESVEVVAGVPVRGGFRFRDVTRAAAIPVLEIRISHAGEYKSVRFRDVAVR